MKLLFDQNLSPKLVGLLADLFPDSNHVQDHSLDLADDDEVWNFAAKHDFIIVSKDEDYNDLSVMRGTAPKVIWVVTGNCKTPVVHALLRDKFAEIEAFVADPQADVFLLG